MFINIWEFLKILIKKKKNLEKKEIIFLTLPFI